MQKQYPIQWESKLPSALLASEPIIGLRVLQHRNQPPAILDILTAKYCGLRVLSRMEYVSNRFEVGRLFIEDIRDDDPASSRGWGASWSEHAAPAPKWLQESRLVEVLSFSDERVSVDSVLRLSNGQNELVVVASSFPCCLEISLTGADALGGFGDLEHFKPEFSIEDLESRQL